MLKYAFKSPEVQAQYVPFAFELYFCDAHILLDVQEGLYHCLGGCFGIYERATHLPAVLRFVRAHYVRRKAFCLPRDCFTLSSNGKAGVFVMCFCQNKGAILDHAVDFFLKDSSYAGIGDLLIVVPNIPCGFFSCYFATDRFGLDAPELGVINGIKLIDGRACSTAGKLIVTLGRCIVRIKNIFTPFIQRYGQLGKFTEAYAVAVEGVAVVLVVDSNIGFTKSDCCRKSSSFHYFFNFFVSAGLHCIDASVPHS